MEKVCGMTWIDELFFRFQKEPADELSSQHKSLSSIWNRGSDYPEAKDPVAFPLNLHQNMERRYSASLVYNLVTRF